MDKYYTPKIEEFHIGFEYEWLDDDDKWIKETSPIEITKEGFDEQTYGLRVKYLDKEDIESLGFVKWIDRENYDLEEYQLHKNNNLNISIYDDASNLIFIGDIKNKSELKKLLKRLNINETR